MKLIYIVNARIPTEKAHGIQIMKMCEAFQKAGFEVELVIPARRTAAVDPLDYYQIEHKFRITRLFSLDLTRFGWPVFFKLQNVIFNLSIIVFLLWRQRPAVLYTREDARHWPKFMTDRFSLFIETHFFWPDKIERNLKAFAKARGLVVITNTYQKVLHEKYGISAEKVLVAPDGVDLGKFKVQKSKVQIRKELNLPTHKRIVLYSGNFFVWKGVGTLLETAKNFQFSTRLPDGQVFSPQILFVFVGGSPYELEKFKSDAQKLDNVLILGHKPPADIPKYLASADVLVLPNSGKSDVSRYYTSPLKLFEYMAANRPIVASDLPSIREVLNNENALLVPPDDPGALGQGIEKVLNDERLAGILAGRARSEVEQYTWEKRCAKISAFIEAYLRS